MAGNHACFEFERIFAEFRSGDRVYDFNNQLYGIVTMVLNPERRGPMEYRYHVDYDRDVDGNVIKIILPEKALIKVR